jgi:mevalonate kinase
MPAVRAHAPGKVILFGEHAVVYGRAAIAAPVQQVRATTTVMAEPRLPAGQVRLQAPDIHLEAMLDELPAGHPLALAVRLVLDDLHVPRLPACTLRITSTIPVASGLGSGAAVTVSLLRAVSAFLGQPLEPSRLSALAYEVEKIHHGTPSGIDNTVIAFEQPVFFVRGQPLETFAPAVPLHLVIGDTGVSSPTAIAVGDVRRAWQSALSEYEALFDRADRISRQARSEIERGDPTALGLLMVEAQEVLKSMGVSSSDLDRLVAASLAAGALGAKLSGGGRGGNMIALVHSGAASQVAAALEAAGAVRTIITVIQ